MHARARRRAAPLRSLLDSSAPGRRAAQVNKCMIGEVHLAQASCQPSMSGVGWHPRGHVGCRGLRDHHWACFMCLEERSERRKRRQQQTESVEGLLGAEERSARQRGTTQACSASRDTCALPLPGIHGRWRAGCDAKHDGISLRLLVGVVRERWWENRAGGEMYGVVCSSDL